MPPRRAAHRRHRPWGPHHCLTTVRTSLPCSTTGSEGEEGGEDDVEEGLRDEETDLRAIIAEELVPLLRPELDADMPTHTGHCFGHLTPEQCAIAMEYVHARYPVDIAEQQGRIWRPLATFEGCLKRQEAERQTLEWELHKATAAGAGEGMKDWGERNACTRTASDAHMARALSEREAASQATIERCSRAPDGAGPAAPLAVDAPLPAASGVGSTTTALGGGNDPADPTPPAADECVQPSDAAMPTASEEARPSRMGREGEG